jgi:hypothetical protein
MTQAQFNALIDGSSVILVALILLVVWSAFWKGLALWHSARRGQPWWFVIFVFVNTLGILELIYLFGIAKLHANELFSMRSCACGTCHCEHHEKPIEPTTAS